jgi:hypothetical protein
MEQWMHLSHAMMMMTERAMGITNWDGYEILSRLGI